MDDLSIPLHIISHAEGPFQIRIFFVVILIRCPSYNLEGCQQNDLGKSNIATALVEAIFLFF
jgi:hypothetical protein